LLPDVVLLGEPNHDYDSNFHEEIDHREEDDEIVQTLLPVLHLVRVPVGDPINHPEEVNEPSHNQQNQKSNLIVLKKSK